MSGFIGHLLRSKAVSTSLALAAVLLLTACFPFDDGGVNTVGEPPTETPDDGLSLEIPTIPVPGASGWKAGQSGDYDFFSAEADDVDHDAHDCVLDDISTSGMDLHQVRAAVWQDDPNGPTWYPELTIVMFPPVDASPDEFLEWAIEIQNSLGILIINQYGEMDEDEFDGPLPDVGLWSSPGTGETGVSLRLPQTYPDPNSAAQALVAWFEGLQVSIRTEATGGAVCDEMTTSGGKSR